MTVEANELKERKHLDTAKVWTMVDFKNPIQSAGQVSSVSFYARNTKPIRIGLYRTHSGTSLNCIKQVDVTPVQGLNKVCLIAAGLSTK